MNSKVTMFLATVISSLVIYLCIYYKKDEIALLLGVGDSHRIHTEVTKKEPANTLLSVQNAGEVSQDEEIKEVEEIPSGGETTPERIPHEEEILKTKVVTEKSDPAFGLMLGETTKIVGMLTPRDRSKALITYIVEYCGKNRCDKDIRYSEDIKDVIWQKGIVKLIKFLKEENINGGSIFINSNVLKVEGELTSVDQEERLSRILTSLKNDGLDVINQTVKMLTNPKETEEIKQDDTKEPNEQKEPEISLQSEIDRILLQDPIEFDVKNSLLTSDSRKTLDRILELLKNSQTQSIEIASYSQRSGDDIYEKVVSQKRADVVKRYLDKNGMIETLSRGYGSTEFKYPENPQDPRNRRIEIRILK